MNLSDRFATELKTLTEAPEPLRSMTQRCLGDAPTDLLVYTPAYRSMRRISPATLLTVTDRGWSIASLNSPGQVTVSKASFADTLLVETTLILLYGCLRIDFVSEGSAETVSTEFNTVMEGLFRKATHLVVNRICHQMAFHSDRSHILESLVQGLPLKFRNRLQEFVPPGQKLLTLMYWPTVLGAKKRFFQRELAPAAVLALTDSELLLIADERNETSSSTGIVNNFGYTITHCPLSRMESFEIVQHDDAAGLHLNLITESGEGEKAIGIPRERVTEMRTFMEEALNYQLIA